MKSYRELADKIFERRDKHLVARKLKRKKIIKRVSATACALVVLLGISAWHLGWFESNEPTVHTQSGEHYYGENSHLSEFEIQLTTTKPTTKKTTNVVEQISESTTITTQPKYTTTTTFHYEYKIDDSGTRVMHVDGDNVHYIFNGVYHILDTNTGRYIKQIALPARPDDMVYRNGEIWVSYPTLCTVLVYDYETFEIRRTIELEHPVTDFDVYGDYLIYAATERNKSYIYRYNMLTGELLYFVADIYQDNKTGWRWSEDEFAEPGILVDETRKYVYVGESGSSSCGIFCFDIDTMEQVMYHWVHGEIMNSSNQMFLIGDRLYWGQCEFDADDISTILWGQQFKVVRRLQRVDERFIYVGDEVYDRITKEMVYVNRSSNGNSKPTLLAVTASGNSFKYQRTAINHGAYLYIVPGEYNEK